MEKFIRIVCQNIIPFSLSWIFKCIILILNIKGIQDNQSELRTEHNSQSEPRQETTSQSEFSSDTYKKSRIATNGSLGKAFPEWP